MGNNGTGTAPDLLTFALALAAAFARQGEPRDWRSIRSALHAAAATTPADGYALLRQWSEEDQAIVDAALVAADLLELADRPLESMSGGQRQRAWIAMAIAQATPLLLLDEPTSALDLGHQIEVFELIRQLAAAGKTIVMVVHDLSSACRYADHLIAMHQGRIVASGRPDEIVTSDLVERLYGVRCTLLRDPLSGTPVIAGVSRL